MERELFLHSAESKKRDCCAGDGGPAAAAAVRLIRLEIGAGMNRTGKGEWGKGTFLDIGAAKFLLLGEGHQRTGGKLELTAKNSGDVVSVDWMDEDSGYCIKRNKFVCVLTQFDNFLVNLLRKRLAGLLLAGLNLLTIFLKAKPHRGGHQLLSPFHSAMPFFHPIRRHPSFANC
jgi:hypothetical protein